MKKILLLGASLLWAAFMMAAEAPFQKAEIKTIMRKVADWQIANPHPAPEHDDLNWPQGALYVGMVDWAELAVDLYRSPELLAAGQAILSC